MEKKIFEYTKKQDVVEIEGKEYKIPLRTAGLEKKLVERERKIHDMTEYESNMLFLEIMFGKDAYNIFPDKEDTDLDKLEKCVRFVAECYMKQHKKLQNDIIKENIRSVKPLVSTVDKLNRAKI